MLLVRASRTSTVASRFTRAAHHTSVSVERSLVKNREPARSLALTVSNEEPKLATKALTIYKPPRSVMLYKDRGTGFVSDRALAVRNELFKPQRFAAEQHGVRTLLKKATSVLSDLRLGLSQRREKAQQIIAGFARENGFQNDAGRTALGDAVMDMFGNEKARARVSPQERGQIMDLMKSLGAELQAIGFSDENEAVGIYRAIAGTALAVAREMAGSEFFHGNAEEIAGEGSKLSQMLDERDGLELDVKVRGLYEQADRQLLPTLQELSRCAVPVDRKTGDRRVISQLSSDIRSLTRHAARQMDKPERMALAYLRDFLKDGNSSGPTFHEMINKKINRQGATAMDALDSLAASAARPNQDVSKSLLGGSKEQGAIE
jgi:hypothetical protein